MRISCSLGSFWCSLACSLSLSLSLALIARAEPLPLTRAVQLGRPAHAQPLRVEVRDAAVRLRIGTAEVALPLETATDATVEEVTLAGGAVVAVVRVQGAGREAAALIALPAGRARVLWSGRTDPHGDPGERQAAVVEVADRTGDGVPEVIVGMIAETARICGTQRTLLFPRAVDPQSQTLRPVVLFQVPTTGAQQELVATAETPGPTGAPLVPGLRFIGASSQDGAGEDPSALSAPHALETPGSGYWAEGRGGFGRGEFVSARRETPGLSIRAFAITPSPIGDAATRLGRPKVLWLVGDQGARVRVTLPEDAALHPGRRYWVVPREPLQWTCVSVVLDEAYLPAGTSEAAARTALAGLEVYTELDFGGGVDQLVRALVGDGPDASSATDLLTRLGPASVAPTSAAWARLSAAGRRRAVRVFAGNARATDAVGDEARQALRSAASDEDADVRGAALLALTQAGAPALAALASVLGAGGAVGDAAAVALGAAGAGSVAPLLTAMDAQGGTERPVLRDALATAVHAGGEAAFTDVDTWLAAAPRTASVRAAVALALSAVPEAAPLAARLVSGTTPDATDFAPRFRLVRATAHLPAEDATDAWLAELAHDAPEWMLRAEALDALAARRSPLLPETARTALGDPYPRVRLAGARALADHAEDLERVARLTVRDPWPLVRAATVALLAPHPRARSVIRAALGDAKESVRAAAITAISSARDRGAWPLVAARLADDDEWPVVISAGLELARTLCTQEVHDAVMAVLRRGLRDDAWAPDAELAIVALETAVMIGGPLADDARQLAERAAAPEALRAAARRLREQAPHSCAGAH